MRYYHDPAGRTVFEEPEPSHEAKYTRHKRPRYLGCAVWVTVGRISANNRRKPDGTWAEPWKLLKHEDYDFRDSPEKAVGWFRSMHMGHWGEEISRDEFDRLAKQYKEEAELNPVEE